MSNILSKYKITFKLPPTNFLVYLLKHETKNRTYVGYTNNLKRRLRQHNGEIKGGARSTTALLKYGKWSVYTTIPNLTKWDALSKEAILHRRRGKGKTPLEKRMSIINELI